MSRHLTAAAAVILSAALASVGLAPSSATAAPTGPVSAAAGSNFVLAEFGYNQGWRVDRHPRFMTDITGDGRADIVGMGDDGVYTSVATGGGGFTPARFVIADFGYGQGWRVERHSRFLADITADGRADIIAIGDDSTYTAIANADGTFGPIQQVGPYSVVSWAPTKFFAVDVNADNRADLVRLIGDVDHRMVIATALGNGTFGPAGLATTAYDFANYDYASFQMADVTGDRRAEILALQVIGPIRMVSSVPLVDGTGRYSAPQPAGAAFPPGLPAPSVTLSAVADATGDGRADLVAFGTAAAGTWVARSFGNGTFDAYRPAVDGYGQNQGWTSSRHVRALADITGADVTGVRTSDIVGFGDAGVYTSVARGDGTFTAGQYVVPDFGYDQGWRVAQHPRFLADITGDGRGDIVGFGNAGVSTVNARGDGTFVLPATVAVPNVRGTTPSGASAALQAAGLVLGQRRYVLDSTCNYIGRVVRQSPGSGAQVNPGSAVDIWIGQRPLRVCP